MKHKFEFAVFDVPNIHLTQRIIDWLQNNTYPGVIIDTSKTFLQRRVVGYGWTVETYDRMHSEHWSTTFRVTILNDNVATMFALIQSDFT